MDAQQAEATFRRAAEAYSAGDAAAALSLCGELLAIAPEHPGVRQLAGVAALRQGDAGTAVEHLSVAARVAPGDAGVQLNLGAALRAAGRHDEAVHAYRQATELAPGRDAGWFNLANTLLHLQRHDEAVDAFRRTLERNPEHAGAAYNLGSMLVAARPDEAVRLLRLATRSGTPTPRTHARLGTALRQSGDLAAAAAALREALAGDPNDVETLALLATVEGEAENHAAAAEHYRAALALAPERADIASNLAWTLAESGEPDAALALAREAVTRDPGLASAHYHLGLIQQSQGALREAEAAMRETIALAPRHVRAYATLALLLEALGDDAEAARISDPARQVRRFMLTEIGEADCAGLNAALAEWVCAHPTLLFDRPNRATTGGAQTLDLAGDDAPSLRRFRRHLEQALSRYLDDRAREGGLPYFAETPVAWDLSIWAVVLSEGGHQAPHNHPSGFVSGVYYVKVPGTVGAGDTAGHIEFGPSNVRDGEGRERASRFRMTVAPREGEMLLFPSYLWHRTIPYAGPEQRISIAFDVLWG